MTTEANGTSCDFKGGKENSLALGEVGVLEGQEDIGLRCREMSNKSSRV